jgi:hypothetical protein
MAKGRAIWAGFPNSLASKVFRNRQKVTLPTVTLAKLLFETTPSGGKKT